MRDKVIIIGAVLVLGAGFALWQMTKDISSVDADPPKPKPEITRTPTTEAPAPSTPAKRDARIAPVAVVQPRSPSHTTGGGAGPALDVGSGSGSAEAPVSPARLIERELKRQLVRQLDGLDGAVSDCVAKFGKGSKLTGASALTLKIERSKTGAPTVVEVAVEPIDTTIKDPALNDCLRDTGRKIVLDLPDGITEVTATHQVNLDGGGITGHDLTAYDFKPMGRPVDPPTPPKP